MNFTSQEKKFIKELEILLYAEWGFSDVEVKDITEKLNIPIKSAKGILGSLVKKGILSTEAYSRTEIKLTQRGSKKSVKYIDVNYEFIHFSKEGAHYHKNFSKELNIEYIEL